MGNGINNKCFICGNESHFSADCPRENQKDEITCKIEKLKNKILELENQKKQKLIDEENSKKSTFNYYFESLFYFIQIKKEGEININNYDVEGNPDPNGKLPNCSSGEDRSIKMRIEENKDLVSALENIYSYLDIINKRLLKLEKN